MTYLSTERNSDLQQAHFNRVELCRWFRSQDNKLKGLILAQNERQRRGLGMQVERDP